MVKIKTFLIVIMKELKVFKQQEVLSKEFKIYGDIENPLSVKPS